MKCAGIIITGKVVAEIIKAEGSICQPRFGFFGSYQIVLVAKRLRRTGNGGFIQIQVEFISASFGFYTMEKFLPFQVKFISENGCINRVARGIFLSSAGAYD